MLTKLTALLLGNTEIDSTPESRVRFGITLLCLCAAALYFYFAVYYPLIGIMNLAIYCTSQGIMSTVLYFHCRKGRQGTYKIAYVLLCASVVILHNMLCYNFGECGTVFIVVAAILPNHLFNILKPKSKPFFDLFLLISINIAFWITRDHVPLHANSTIATLKFVLLNCTMLVCFFELYLGFLFQKYTERMHRDQIAYTSYAAQIDPLTGLGNRYKYNLLKEEVEKEGAPQDSIYIALLDIDHFKQINDIYGHKAGDQVLQTLAKTLEKTFRKDDFLIRWGGEEFLLIFRGLELPQILQLIERLRNHLKNNPLHYEGQMIYITVTIGIQQHDFSRSLDDTVETADKKMYMGKSSGRDCVISEPFVRPR